MPLTDSQIRQARAKGKRLELPDGNELALRFSADGSKRWTVAYRVLGPSGTGPKRRMYVGEYPEVGLQAARARAAEIKLDARAGPDPALRTSPNSLPVGEIFELYWRENALIQLQALAQ